MSDGFIPMLTALQCDVNMVWIAVSGKKLPEAIRVLRRPAARIATDHNTAKIKVPVPIPKTNAI